MCCNDKFSYCFQKLYFFSFVIGTCTTNQLVHMVKFILYHLIKDLMDITHTLIDGGHLYYVTFITSLVVHIHRLLMCSSPNAILQKNKLKHFLAICWG